MKRREFTQTMLAGMGGAMAGVSLSSPPGQAQEARGARGHSAGAARLSIQVGSTIEVTSSFRKCWFPTIHRFSNGDLMTTMRMSPDEVNPEGDFSAYCLSRNGGRTWSRRYTMGAGANVDGAWSQVARPDGSIWQLYGWVDADPEHQTQGFYLTRTEFHRSGMEFRQRRNVPLRMSEPVETKPTKLFDREVQDGKLASQPIMLPWGPILDTGHASMIAPLYYTPVEDQRYYHLALIRSDDDGETWRQVSTIAAVMPGANPWPGMGSEGPCEAGMVRLADGKLFALFRTGGNGFIGAAWSSNDGETWTPPVSLPHKGVALRVRRLSNGALACTTGRPGPVVVMFSADGTGETWSHVTPIFTGKSTHYTDFVEIEPGKLLVVYDSVPYGWYNIPDADRTSKNRIYATFVNVRTT